MDASGADDGTDFRPFFDMVIGILFVLLILVAAQIYFQQAQDETAVNDAAKREAMVRRADIAAFLDAFAGRLRAEGLNATADAEAGAVLLPLRQVVSVGGAGLPSVAVDAQEKLGAPLSAYTACVTQPRSAAVACSNFVRLALDLLTVRVRVGELPSGVLLPRNRFGDLAEALLAAVLLGGEPALIGASNEAGGRVVTFGTAAASPGISGSEVGGDLVLDFQFQ